MKKLFVFLLLLLQCGACAYGMEAEASAVKTQSRTTSKKTTKPQADRLSELKRQYDAFSAQIETHESSRSIYKYRHDSIYAERQYLLQRQNAMADSLHNLRVYHFVCAFEQDYKKEITKNSKRNIKSKKYKETKQVLADIRRTYVRKAGHCYDYVDKAAVAAINERFTPLLAEVQEPYDLECDTIRTLTNEREKIATMMQQEEARIAAEKARIAAEKARIAAEKERRAAALQAQQDKRALNQLIADFMQSGYYEEIISYEASPANIRRAIIAKLTTEYAHEERLYYVGNYDDRVVWRKGNTNSYDAKSVVESFIKGTNSEKQRYCQLIMINKLFDMYDYAVPPLRFKCVLLYGNYIRQSDLHKISQAIKQYYINKYGTQYGLAVVNQKLMIGMTYNMCKDAFCSLIPVAQTTESTTYRVYIPEKNAYYKLVFKNEKLVNYYDGYRR